jgi:hypothetical protein
LGFIYYCSLLNCFDSMQMAEIEDTYSTLVLIPILAYGRLLCSLRARYELWVLLTR